MLKLTPLHFNQGDLVVDLESDLVGIVKNLTEDRMCYLNGIGVDVVDDILCEDKFYVIQSPFTCRDKAEFLINIKKQSLNEISLTDAISYIQTRR